MILFWDNGEEYSDHGIEFIDIGDFDPRTAAECIADVRGGKVFGGAPAVDWWEGGCETLAEFLAHFVHYWEEGDHTATFLRLPADVRAAVIAEAEERLARTEAHYPQDVDSARRLVAALRAAGAGE